MEPHIDLTWNVLGVVLAALAIVGGAQVGLIKLMIRSEVDRAIRGLHDKFVLVELCKERHDACRADLIHRIAELSGVKID